MAQQDTVTSHVPPVPRVDLGNFRADVELIVREQIQLYDADRRRSETHERIENIRQKTLTHGISALVGFATGIGGALLIQRWRRTAMK